MPICADEPIETADDVQMAAKADACDVVNVKLATSGGVSGTREALRAAREHGLGAFVSSTLDGPWGIAAALQLAASERISLACGLATLELFDARIARALPTPETACSPCRRVRGSASSVSEDALAEVLVEEVEH